LGSNQEWASHSSVILALVVESLSVLRSLWSEVQECSVASTELVVAGVVNSHGDGACSASLVGGRDVKWVLASTKIGESVSGSNGESDGPSLDSIDFVSRGESIGPWVVRFWYYV
jgi:hypothetical protein